jgi:hypothetical protein
MIKLIKIQDKDNHFDQCNVMIDIPNSHVTLTDLLPIFAGFLRACGYVFQGELEIVDVDQEREE